MDKRVAFWIGVGIVVFVLVLVAAITFSSGPSEYGGGGGY
jgi:hypothetical protein